MHPGLYAPSYAPAMVQIHVEIDKLFFRLREFFCRQAFGRLPGWWKALMPLDSLGAHVTQYLQIICYNTVRALKYCISNLRITVNFLTSSVMRCFLLVEYSHSVKILSNRPLLSLKNKPSLKDIRIPSLIFMFQIVSSLSTYSVTSVSILSINLTQNF